MEMMREEEKLKVKERKSERERGRDREREREKFNLKNERKVTKKRQRIQQEIWLKCLN